MPEYLHSVLSDRSFEKNPKVFPLAILVYSHTERKVVVISQYPPPRGPEIGKHQIIDLLLKSAPSFLSKCIEEALVEVSKSSDPEKYFFNKIAFNFQWSLTLSPYEMVTGENIKDVARTLFENLVIGSSQIEKQNIKKQPITTLSITEISY